MILPPEIVTVIDSVPYRPPLTGDDAWYVPFFGPLGGGVVGFGGGVVGGFFVAVGLVVVGVFVPVGLVVAAAAAVEPAVVAPAFVAPPAGVAPAVGEVPGLTAPAGPPPDTDTALVSVPAAAVAAVAAGDVLPNLAPMSSAVPVAVPNMTAAARRMIILLLSGAEAGSNQLELERVQVDLAFGNAQAA